MRGITIRDILDITKGHLLDKIDNENRTQLLNTEIKDIVIDSRQAASDMLFIAIKGENVDAHKFIPKVAEVCKAILTEEDEAEILAVSDGMELPRNIAYIRVASTNEALKDIGAAIRNKYEKQIIGVTGSVGKTTTREMISHALRSSLNVFETQGNMNSQIGVPLTLSHILDEPSDVAVLEMGISEPGGMDNLTKMVKPDLAVVTVIGVAHIEFMKTQYGIREEKLRIAGRMDEDGVIFMNADDPLLWEMSGKMKQKVIFFGENSEADYKAENIRYENGFNTYDFVHNNQRITVNLNALGVHNVRNSLVAMAICDYLGLDLMKAASSFETFNGLRQKVIQAEKGYTIIDDTYNASPDSMKAAINVLAGMNNTGKCILVLGDMYELGPDADKYHTEVGEYVSETVKRTGSIDEFIAVGENANNFVNGAKNQDTCIVSGYADKSEALAHIKEILSPGDVILIKASNGMKLSEFVSELEEFGK